MLNSEEVNASMGQELAIRQTGISAADLMPVLDLSMAVKRHNFMVDVTKQLMIQDVDFGVIPGTSKPTLLKPGAERLCNLFGLSPELVELAVVEDWTGEHHSGEPFFYYRYKIRLLRNAFLLGEGVGSCNSWETKYRYRTAERKCPVCGKASIITGKAEYGGGYLCFGKKGGCGAKFLTGDPAIEGQNTGRVSNPEVAETVNTIQKMAHKRALISAVLGATNASEFYTQDVEDMVTIDVPVHAASSEPKKEPTTVTPPPSPDPGKPAQFGKFPGKATSRGVAQKPAGPTPAQAQVATQKISAMTVPKPIHPALEARLKSMVDRKTIGDVFNGLLDDLATKFGGPEGEDIFKRVLSSHMTDKGAVCKDWQELKDRGEAKKFATELWDLLEVPMPGSAEDVLPIEMYQESSR